MNKVSDLSDRGLVIGNPLVHLVDQILIRRPASLLLLDRTFHLRYALTLTRESVLNHGPSLGDLDSLDLQLGILGGSLKGCIIKDANGGLASLNGGRIASQANLGSELLPTVESPVGTTLGASDDGRHQSELNSAGRLLIALRAKDVTRTKEGRSLPHTVE